MADKQEIFAKMKATLNGVLDQIETEKRNLLTENEQLKNENTVLKGAMEEKKNEIKKFDEELSAAKKTIEVLDPTGTGRRIVNHAHLFQTKEVDKMSEKIVSLEKKNAEQLKLIEILQRIEFEQRAELEKTYMVQGANNDRAVDKIKRKRKAETSLKMIEEQSRNEKKNVIGSGRITNFNGLADAKFVCASSALSLVIDNDGKLRVAHRNDAMEFSVKDVGVKFKSVVSDKSSSVPGAFYVIDEDNQIWSNGSWYNVNDCRIDWHLLTATNTKHEFKLHKIGLKAIDMDTCGYNTACVSPEGNLIFWRVFSSVNFPPDCDQHPDESIRKIVRIARNHRLSSDPRTIRIFEKLSQVALGDHHILVLGISGSVYSAEKTDLGRKSIRAGQLNAADFKKVKFAKVAHAQSANEKIIQIACSMEQSAALTTDGLVYVWGKNFDSRKSIKIPTCLDLWPTVVQSISMSNEHVLALTQNNEVYAWSMYMSGQCGIIDKPKLVEKLSGYKVTQISAGPSHSLAIYES